MKIPDKVKIGSKWFNVRHGDVLRDESDELVLGLMFQAPLRIEISNHADKTMQETVFIHEIIEAINAMYGLNLPHGTIDCLGEALYQVLTENDLFGVTKNIKYGVGSDTYEKAQRYDP